MFCLLLWVWAGAGGEFMRKPVGKWSNEDVVQWMDGLGEWTQHNYSDIFRKEVRGRGRRRGLSQQTECFCHMLTFTWISHRSSHHSTSSPSLLQKITGPQLLLLNEKALTMLGVDIEFRRQTILQAVQELRVREFSAPRNFPEFKVRHSYCSLL